MAAPDYVDDLYEWMVDDIIAAAEVPPFEGKQGPVLVALTVNLTAILAVLASKLGGQGLESDVETLREMSARWHFRCDALAIAERQKT